MFNVHCFNATLNEETLKHVKLFRLFEQKNSLPL
jgi:hypothetical protein